MAYCAKNELQIKTIFFIPFLAGFELATSESAIQCLIHWATAENLHIPLQKLRMHPPDHQAGVAQAISPISMKLGQFEGFNLKPKNPK